MKIWFDTEFIEDGKTIDLISIGMVSEDNRTLYLENNQCDLSLADTWVKENVISKLSMSADVLRTRGQIAEAVYWFAGDDPEFWAYYADYDWVALCQLFGRMVDLPKGWPMYCLDLKQELHRKRMHSFTLDAGVNSHNALADAIALKQAWHKVMSREHEYVPDGY